MENKTDEFDPMKLLRQVETNFLKRKSVPTDSQSESLRARLREEINDFPGVVRISNRACQPFAVLMAWIRLDTRAREHKWYAFAKWFKEAEPLLKGEACFSKMNAERLKSSARSNWYKFHSTTPTVGYGLSDVKAP